MCVELTLQSYHTTLSHFQPELYRTMDNICALLLRALTIRKHGEIYRNLFVCDVCVVKSVEIRLNTN